MLKSKEKYVSNVVEKSMQRILQLQGLDMEIVRRQLLKRVAEAFLG